MRAHAAIAVCLALATSAAAQPQPALDAAAVEALKEVHDRGAALYNAGDAAGCLRMYEGALRVAKGVLAHRPKSQATITAALDNLPNLVGDREQAFELHKVIEAVRGELKGAPGVPQRVPAPDATPIAPRPEATAASRVTLDGKPLAGAEVLLISVNRPLPKVLSLVAGPGGALPEAAALPEGDYLAVVRGEGVPARFASPATTPLRVAVAGGKLATGLELKSE